MSGGPTKLRPRRPVRWRRGALPLLLLFFQQLRFSTAHVAPQPSHFELHMRNLLGVPPPEDLHDALLAAAWQAQARAAATGTAAGSEYVHWRLGRGRRLAVADGSDDLPAIQAPGLNTAPQSADMNTTFVRHASVIEPDFVDWRASPSLNTSVLDQGPCESCWVAAATDIIAMHWSLMFHLLTPIPLSPQHVCDCSFSGRCCGGGWPEWTFLFSVFNKGIAPLDSYPYLGMDAYRMPSFAWTSRCRGVSSSSLSGRITGWEKLPAADFAALRKTVAQHPVLVLLYASHSLLTYSGGIWYGPDCGRNPTVNHALIVVGFNSSASEPYWIAKNTWGPGWGEGGFVRIAMKGTICGFGSEPSLYPTLFNLKTPCDATPTPCGAGTCYLMSDLESARCLCPAGFVERIENSAPKCVSANPCSAGINPCAFGACKDRFDGSYTCTCPVGTIIGARADGGETCIVNSFQSGLNTYAALPGDTCQMLAATFNLSDSALAAMNPFLNCTAAILPGTLVVIAGLSDGAGCSSRDVVQPSDSCASLAQRNHITASQLQTINPGLSCDSLHVSQHVCVSPGQLAVSSPYERSCGSAYTTQDGDTCLSILSSTNITLQTLQWLNPGIDCSSPLPINTICTAPLTLGLAGVSCDTYYNITHADTCFTVANAVGLSIAQFLDLNPGLRCYWPNWVVGLSVCVNGSTTPLSQVESPPNLVPYFVKSNITLAAIAQSYADKCDNAPSADNSSNPDALQPFISDICEANGWDDDCSDRQVVVGTMILVPCLHNIGTSSCAASSFSMYVCGNDMVTYSNYACALYAMATPLYSYGPCTFCQQYCVGYSGARLGDIWGYVPGCNNQYVCPFPAKPTLAMATQMCLAKPGVNVLCQLIQVQCSEAVSSFSLVDGCPLFAACMKAKGCFSTTRSPCGYPTFAMQPCKSAGLTYGIRFG